MRRGVYRGARRGALPPDDVAHARLVGYLARRTEGDAPFPEELRRGLEGEGLLRRAGDRWMVGDLNGASVPAPLRRVVAGRVARRDPETRRPLTFGYAERQTQGLVAAISTLTVSNLRSHHRQGVEPSPITTG